MRTPVSKWIVMSLSTLTIGWLSGCGTPPQTDRGTEPTAPVIRDESGPLLYWK